MASFAWTEEQDLLRKTARDMLASRATTKSVRETMATTDAVDLDLWREISQMGWAGLAVPEEHGGAGYGFTEVGVVAEQMGFALPCVPFLSSAVLGAQALLLSGDEDACSRLLPGVASGETRFALGYLPPSGSHDPGATDLRATAVADGGWRLRGEVAFVLDGHTAESVVVVARTGEVGEASAFVVPGDAPGLTREAAPVMDQTRPQARLRFDDVEVDDGALVGEADAYWPVLQQVLTRGIVTLVNEMAGGAQRVLEMSVAYARERRQFGRAIGSYQAIKHRCADMLVLVENARTLAYHAARTLDAGDEAELALAAPMAKSYCGDVYEQVAGDNIQNHGGIGFTWEHDAHLWFKRAKSSKLLFGGGREHRRILGNVLGF